MTKWRWDRRAEKEFQDACADTPAGRALKGEVASALQLLRKGGTHPPTRARGRIRSVPVHAEKPWCVLYGRQGDRLLIGLHLAECDCKDLPAGAYAIAEARLTSPDL